VAVYNAVVDSFVVVEARIAYVEYLYLQEQGLVTCDLTVELWRKKVGAVLLAMIACYSKNPTTESIRSKKAKSPLAKSFFPPLMKLLFPLIKFHSTKLKISKKEQKSKKMSGQKRKDRNDK
jgi:hypothetical protein